MTEQMQLETNHHLMNSDRLEGTSRHFTVLTEFLTNAIDRVLRDVFRNVNPKYWALCLTASCSTGRRINSSIFLKNSLQLLRECENGMNGRIIFQLIE